MSQTHFVPQVDRGPVREEHPVDTTPLADKVKVVNTNGTTPVNVFGPKGCPFPLTITAFMLISKDATGGNITLTNNGQTVAQVAKGTDVGAVVGEELDLVNFKVKTGATVQLSSSSAGNAACFVFYTADAQ